MLVKTRRVVVIIDGASEMPAFTKGGGARVDETFPACALIVTARSCEPFRPGGYTDILPQRIDSDHLIPFMNTYLAHLDVQIDDSRLYEACRRLSDLVGKERGITPLLAQMYARTLVQFSDRRSLAPILPNSIPELMLIYVNVLNRGETSKEWGDIEVQTASKQLAWNCIRHTYHPNLGAVADVVPNPVSQELFSYLEHRLRLIDTAGDSYEFVFDPLAEYLGAIRVVESNRGDETLWIRLIKSLDEASGPGRQTAGFLVALHDSLTWRGRSCDVPPYIIEQIRSRVGQPQSGTAAA
jgi:hypothetical protein